MKQLKKWYDSYRGIGIEAVTWSWPDEVKAQSDFFNKENWCGYIYLDSRNHPEINEIEVDYSSKYTDRVTYFDRFDFHGGVTFSEVTKHRETLRIKIGCDYQHYWDEQFKYDQNDVISDLKRVVDQYRELHPEKFEDANG